ncbi:MAG TPA: hypothetical protein VHK26_12745, partial [Methyloceanibacter sp.]|nr:hypothetical protein [Methyloceanibacter sp.]
MRRSIGVATPPALKGRYNIYMPTEPKFDNPTVEEISKVRALKREQGDLSAGDEQFLRELWRRCQCYEARNVLLTRLLPLIGAAIRDGDVVQGVARNISIPKIEFSNKPRHERPMGVHYELIAEAMVGSETGTDREQGVIRARGVVGTLDKHNPN